MIDEVRKRKPKALKPIEKDTYTAQPLHIVQISNGRNYANLQTEVE